MKQGFSLALALVLGAALGSALPQRFAVPASAQSPTSSDKSPADRGYMEAMTQMRQTMMQQTMTGNPDRDFMMMMIPHHQSAIAMAQTELKYGNVAKVKALAKNIIANQQREISQMRDWLSSP